MSWLALATLFEYCGSTAIFIMYFRAGIDFKHQNLMSKGDPRTERVEVVL